MSESRVIVTAQAEQAIREFERLRVQGTGSMTALAAAGNAGNRVLDSTRMSAAATANAMRQVPAQFTDIVTSLQGGQAPLTVFLQQGGQLRDMFGSAGGAAKALGGYVLGLVNPLTIAAAVVGVLAYAYHEGAAESKAYTQAMTLSANAAGATAGQLSEIARNVSKVVGTQGAAAESLAALVATGKVQASDLEQFATVSIKGQRALGQSVGDTAKQFADLAKAPGATLEKLNEQYHFLTGSVYEQVRALDMQGRTLESGQVAQKAFANAFDGMTTRVTANLGTLERGWTAVKDGAKGAWDAMLDIGREESLEDRLKKVQARLSVTPSANLPNGLSAGAAGRSAAFAAQLAADKLEEASLRAQIDDRDVIAAQDAESARHRDDDVAWSKTKEQFLNRQQQLTLELQSVENKGRAAHASDKEIQTALLGVRLKYSDIYNDSIDSQIARLQQRNALEDLTNKRLIDQVNLARAIGQAGEAATIADTAAIEIAAFDQKRSNLEQELALIKRKQNSLKDQQAKSGEIAALEEQQISRRMQLTNDLYVLQSKTETEIFDRILQSTAARNDANTSLEIEYAYYGKTADARELALAAARADAELEKYIGDLRRAGKPVTDEMIGQLKAEKDIRTQVANATTGQSKALGYAQQLATENKKFATEYIFDEQQRAAAVLRIDDEMWQERIRLAGEGTVAQKKLQDEYSTWYQNQLQKPKLDEWKSSVQNYNDVFRTGFADMMNDGLDGWRSFTKSLRTTFKTTVADQIYKMFAQPVVVQVVGSMLGITGAGASGLASAAGGAAPGAGTIGGYVSIAQSAKTAYDAITGGLTGGLGAGITAAGNLFGSSAVAAFGSGISGGSSVAGAAQAYAAAGNTTVATSLNAGAAVSQYIPAVAVAVASYFAATTIAGQYRIEGVGNALNFLGAAGGLLNRAFGRGPEQVTGRSLTGTLGNGTFSGTANENIHQDGGWFRSDYNGVRQTALDGTASKALSDAYEQIKTASADFATTLGLDATSIASRSQALNVTITTDAEANKKAIADFFIGVGDTIATELVPSIQQFIKEGETASSTLQRIAGDYAFVDTALNAFGKQFGTVGLQSVEARERLVQLSGGIDALGKGSAFFTQNFLTEAERLVPVAKTVSAEFAKLGVAEVDTREQFKNLVLGLDLTTAAGAATYVGLTSIQEAFAQLHPELDAVSAAGRTAADVLAERTDLQKQLDQLTLTSEQLRAKDRLAIASDNLDLFDQITRRQEINAATDAFKGLYDSLKTNREGITAYMNSLQIGALSTLTPMQRYLETQRQYADSLAKAQASPADSAAQTAAQSAASTFLSASQVIYASSSSYVADRAKVLGDMGTLSTIVGSQLSDAQKQLGLANDQVTGIATLNTTALGIQQAIVNLGGGAATAIVAPSFDSATYSGTADGRDVLVQEIKRLNSRIDDLVKVTEGRRGDAQKQADLQLDATDKTGEVIAKNLATSVERTTWRDRNPTARGPR